MKVYLAGSSTGTNRTAVKMAMAGLRGVAGIEVTHDWIASIERVEAEQGLDVGLDRDFRRECAEADLRGVRDADIVWVLIPSEGGAGLWIELGYALALRDTFVGRPRPRILVSPACRRARSIFLDLDAVVLFEEDEDVVSYLRDGR